MKNAVGISHDFLDSTYKEYQADHSNSILRNALNKCEIAKLVSSNDFSRENDFNFNVSVKTMSATSQNKSGRCWIFAATNLLREKIAKECDIKEFELSQSFVAFYDRLEKINYELESIIDLIDKDHDDRTLSYILKVGVGDGGQWDMFVNIVKKYGICPKNVMPENYQSSNTSASAGLINSDLKKFAGVAKDLYAKEGLTAVRKLKDEYLAKYYRFLINCYGKPVESFDFEYTDSKENYHLEKGYTPKTFFDKYIGSYIDEFVSIINSPTEDKPFDQIYTIDYLGNVVDGKLITHLNLPIERLKELCIKQLKDDSVVWFGCDCSKYGNRETGVWDDKSYNYAGTFGLDYKIDKAMSLDYFVSQMNHAMLLTAVNIRDDKPNRWKIENSWGDKIANKGYFICSDSWFDQYVYQAVINKKYLSKAEQKSLEKDLVHLKPWDPMGSLAL